MHAKRHLAPGTVVVAVPWLSLGLLLAFAGLAAAQVGHWPHYNQPDPSDVELGYGWKVGGVITLLILVSFLASLCAFGAVSIAALLTVVDEGGLVTERSSRALARLAVTILGLCVFSLVLKENAKWLAD